VYRPKKCTYIHIMEIPPRSGRAVEDGLARNNSKRASRTSKLTSLLADRSSVIHVERWSNARVKKQIIMKQIIMK